METIVEFFKGLTSAASNLAVTLAQGFIVLVMVMFLTIILEVWLEKRKLKSLLKKSRNSEKKEDGQEKKDTTFY